MNYEGIIINMTKSKSIVTTNDFQCFYIKRCASDYIGKEIEFTEKDIIRKRPVYEKLIMGAACILFLFVLMSFSNIINISDVKDIFLERKVFAYVDVDINPSIEIEIDDMGNVIRMIALNEDAKVLVKKLNIGNVNVSKAVSIIMDEVKKDKSINLAQKDYILVSSTLNNKKSESDKEYQADKKKLDDIMNSLKMSLNKKENLDVKVYLIYTDISKRKDAQKDGISTGRYVLYEECKNAGKGFSVEEAKKIDVDDLLKFVLNNIREEKNTGSIAEPTPTALKEDSANQNEDTKGSDTKLYTPVQKSNETQKPSVTQNPNTAQNIRTTQNPVQTNKAVSTVKPTPVPIKNPVTVYQNANYNGWAIALDVGEYDMFELFNKGIFNDEASSVKVASGYKVTLYEHYDFTGKNIELTSDSSNLAAYGMDNMVSAIKVEPNNAKTSSVKPGNSQFVRLESYNYLGRFIRHQSFEGRISENVSPFDDSVFKLTPGLADPDCISFESKNFPGYYLMHDNFKIVLKKFDGSDDFRKCATFRKVSGLADKNLVSFQSINYPERYIRHKMFYLHLDEIATDLEKKDATFIEIKE